MVIIIQNYNWMFVDYKVVIYLEEKSELVKKFLTHANDLKIYSDDDNIKYKEIIKKQLLNSSELLYFLNSKEFDWYTEPDMFFGTNIKPYLLVPEIQSSTQNYICYKIDFSETPRYSENLKYADIIFVILCAKETSIEPKTGLPRHDLLAHIIKDNFNWTNLFGNQCRLVSEKESVTDSNFTTRTLIFELTTTNSLTKNGKVLGQGLNYNTRGSL